MTEGPRKAGGFSSDDKSRPESEFGKESENERERNGEEGEAKIRETKDGNRKKIWREVKKKTEFPRIGDFPKGLTLHTLTASEGRAKSVVENALAISKPVEKLEESKDLPEKKDATADDFKRSLREALSRSKTGSLNESGFGDELEDMSEMRSTAVEVAGNEDEAKENSSLTPHHMEVAEKENLGEIKCPSNPDKMDMSDNSEKEIESPSNDDNLDDHEKETTDKLEQIR